jgi:hypothetical protein
LPRNLELTDVGYISGSPPFGEPADSKPARTEKTQATPGSSR